MDEITRTHNPHGCAAHIRHRISGSQVFSPSQYERHVVWKEGTVASIRLTVTIVATESERSPKFQTHKISYNYYFRVQKVI